LLRALGIRTVYTAHNLMPHEAPRQGDREAFTNLYRAVDRVVVFGEGSRRELVDSFGVAADRIRVIPHGSDGLVFSNVPRETARAELGIGPERKVILFFGHIKRYKGLEYLVQAFDSLRARVDGALLLIAGKVEKGDAGESERYAELLESLRAREDVVCASEYIPVSRVGAYFGAADVVALPYVETYHSGILMAAYAAGRPVVATDTGTLAEDVEEGRTGFVVPPKDAGALADRLVEILTRPDRGRSMGDEARRLSETRYSWSAVAGRTLALYRELVEGGEKSQSEARPDPAGTALRDSDGSRTPVVRGGRS
jgi:glycosyltransferase involved in cell wall biosynthesis